MTENKIIKLTPSLKKKIKADWHKCLPGMTEREKTFNLSRRIGPLLITIGFDTKSGNDRYYPGFCVHNLAHEDEFLSAALNDSLRSKYGGPDWIECRWHDRKYVEAAERMKQQASLPLEGPVSLRMIVKAYQKYVSLPTCGYRVDLVEDPILIAAWANQPKVAQEVLNWGYNIMRTRYNISEEETNAWKRQIEERISNPQKLREIVEQEVIKHKLTHIPCEELVID